jgi:SAM-dependent methyltransferase
MHERHSDKQLYFNEQVYTTERYVIPFLMESVGIRQGLKVLEIGCGEGGNLKPFMDLGCHVTGIDILESKIENARNFLQTHTNYDKAVFLAKDIYLAEEDLKDQYDIILMRDVIEHIHDQDRFMAYVKRFMKPGTVFFLAFPPWQNPFGGHQQVAENRILSKLPYYHLFPKSIYSLILKAGGESKSKIEAFLEIKETGISIERFEKILGKHEYKVIKKTFFFINPNYEVKFGMKPKKQLRLIAAIPFFRNFLITATYYLVKIN